MGFQMKFDKTSFKGPEPEPAGIYRLRLIGFKPQLAKSGNSWNLNPFFEFSDITTHKGEPKKLYYAFYCNTSEESAPLVQDFCHSFGEVMEDDPNDPEAPARLPGVFDADKLKFKEDDTKTWVYAGPLLNKTCKVELYTEEWNGQNRNRILRFFCAVPHCAERFPTIRHSENMNWGSKKEK